MLTLKSSYLIVVWYGGVCVQRQLRRVTSYSTLTPLSMIQILVLLFPVETLLKLSGYMDPGFHAEDLHSHS